MTLGRSLRSRSARTAFTFRAGEETGIHETHHDGMALGADGRVPEPLRLGASLGEGADLNAARLPTESGDNSRKSNF